MKLAVYAALVVAAFLVAGLGSFLLAVRPPRLTVPHARFRERPFVLEPLAELAPGWIDPVTGKTVAELLSQLTGTL